MEEEKRAMKRHEGECIPDLRQSSQQVGLHVNDMYLASDGLVALFHLGYKDLRIEPLEIHIISLTSHLPSDSQKTACVQTGWILQCEAATTIKMVRILHDKNKCGDNKEVIENFDGINSPNIMIFETETGSH